MTGIHKSPFLVGGVFTLIALALYAGSRPKSFNNADSGSHSKVDVNRLRPSTSRDASQLDQNQSFTQRSRRKIAESLQTLELSEIVNRLLEEDEQATLELLSQSSFSGVSAYYIALGFRDYCQRFPILEGINRYEILRDKNSNLFEAITVEYLSSSSTSASANDLIGFLTKPENVYFFNASTGSSVRQLAAMDPLATLEALESITDQQERDLLVSKTYETWIKQDPEATTLHLLENRPNVNLDRAIQTLVYANRHSIPEQLIPWVKESVRDGELRNELLTLLEKSAHRTEVNNMTK